MVTRRIIRITGTLGTACIAVASLAAWAPGQGQIQSQSQIQPQSQSPGSRPAPGAGGKLIDLRPKFEMGQEIRYEMRTETTTVFQADAGDLDLENSRKIQQQLDLVFKVIESDPEKGSKIEVLVERVTARIATDSGDIVFDSAKPPKGEPEREEGMVFSALSKMVGSSVLLTVEPSGRIASISAPSTLGGAGAFEAVALGGGGRLTTTAGGIGLPFGELLSMGHPTGLVKPREEWTNTDKLGGTEMNMITTHKVRSASGNSAKVAISGKIEHPSEDGAADGAGDPMASMIKGFVFDGDYDWDTAKGQLNKMDVRSEFKMERGPLKYETQMVCGVRRAR
jgi:hypothetical protein